MCIRTDLLQFSKKKKKKKILKVKELSMHAVTNNNGITKVECSSSVCKHKDSTMGTCNNTVGGAAMHAATMERSGLIFHCRELHSGPIHTLT